MLIFSFLVVVSSDRAKLLTEKLHVNLSELRAILKLVKMLKEPWGRKEGLKQQRPKLSEAIFNKSKKRG